MRGALSRVVAVTCVLWLHAAIQAATIDITGGALELHGSIAASDVVVAFGATLAGSGRIDGNLNLTGTVTPGNSAASVGSITIIGDLTCQVGSKFVCDVTSHVNSDALFADQVSGTCAVLVRQADGAIPVDLEIINGSAGSAYGNVAMEASQSNSWRLSTLAGDLLLTDLVGDSDGDDLSDWWELAYFSSRTNAVASADGDGDGANNLNEETAGTHPGDPQSRFAITSLADSSGDITITWASSTGRVYRISRTTDLFSDFLPIASNIAATPAYNTYRDEDIINETSYFYRIEIQ